MHNASSVTTAAVSGPRLVALITGASAGIGVEFARRLAARGYDLVLVARRRDRLDALAREIVAAHPRVRVDVIAQDLLEPSAIERIATELAAANVAVDLLVNNAGFGAHGAFAQSDPASGANQIALNVAALVALSRAFVSGMVARGRGGIINVASTAAFQPLPQMAVYGATKAFVLSFSEALHEEVRRSGVRVLALCPGATDTEFFGIAGESAAVGTKRDVRDVVETGLRAFASKRAVAIDGLLNAALATGVRFMPRAAVRRTSAVLMKSP
jgi:short-subunit dehydrogenase